MPEESEPMEEGICRSCARKMELPAYLAESLRLRKAPWPFCQSCTERDRAFARSK